MAPHTVIGEHAHGRASLLLVGVVLVGACAAPPPEALVSPTGIVYELGTPPEETRLSQTATLYLRQDRSERALELALEGIAGDTVNPIHYYLAGVANTRLERLLAADSMFREAERRYPAYELDIEPEREAAWATAFNAGLRLYEAGDVEGTIEVWTAATVISDLRHEAHRNLATVLTLEGRYDQAVQVYQAAIDGLAGGPATRVLSDEERASRSEASGDMEAELASVLMLTERFGEAEPILRALLERDPRSVQLRGDLAAALNGLGREAEAQVIYRTLLSEDDLQATQLFNFGVALFRSEQFEEAAAAFRRLAELQPRSRDAWFNLVNSLFAAEAWQELGTAGARLLEVDPLNENAHLIAARALLESGNESGARGMLATVDAHPAYVVGLQLRRSGAETRVTGRVTGNSAEPGYRLGLRFTFYDDSGSPIGDRTIHLVVPDEESTTPLEVVLPARASAFSYTLLR